MFSNHNFFVKSVFVYFILYTIPFPINVFPYIDAIGDVFIDIWQFLIPWFAANVLSLDEPIIVFTNGSGDTTYDYVFSLFILCLSLIAASIWNYFEKDKKSNKRLNYWLLIGVRFFVGYMLLSYGMVKLIKLQFPYPSFSRLVQPVGSMSPMGLAWTFMGHSMGYNVFTGLAESFAGLLLMIDRRTSLFGALLSLVVIGNVMAINFFFDVPVKLFSSHLFLFSLIVIMPHARRILNVLFNREAIALASQCSVFPNSKFKTGSQVIKYGFVLFVVLSNVKSGLAREKSHSERISNVHLYGLYHSKEIDFRINQEYCFPTVTESTRWKYVNITYNDYLRIHFSDDKKKGYTMDLDTANFRMTLSPVSDSTDVSEFFYIKTDSTLYMFGLFEGDSIEFTGKSLQKSDFLLMSREFNWIQEYPFNR